MKWKPYAIFLSCLAPLLSVVAFAEDVSPAETAAAPQEMMGAKAVIAAALRAPEANHVAVETNAYDRFLLAVQALEETRCVHRGAVPAADWLAAVDLALAVPQGEKATGASATVRMSNKPYVATVGGKVRILLAVFPGSSEWDAVRTGLRASFFIVPGPGALLTLPRSPRTIPKERRTTSWRWATMNPTPLLSSSRTRRRWTMTFF